MTQEPNPKFQVGDVVKIVDTPYRNCPFIWVGDMTKHCGKCSTIRKVFWSESYNIYGYYIDDSYYKWCENCFDDTVSDIQESEENMDILLVGLTP